MIVVTGATGQLGSAVVDRLLERVPAEQIGVSVRDPRKAAGLAERGVRVRHGDFDDAASLADAFEGAEQVLLVSASTTGEGALRQHRTAIEAAAQGRRRADRLHQPHGREPGVAVRAHAGPRRHGGDAGGVGRRVHLAAQRLLRVVGPDAPRPGPGDRRARRPGRRPGLLDRPRGPRRGGGDRPDRARASTARRPP